MTVTLAEASAMINEQVFDTQLQEAIFTQIADRGNMTKEFIELKIEEAVLQEQLSNYGQW
jgi:hypothetical protein